jgi:hypothetical protein
MLSPLTLFLILFSYKCLVKGANYESLFMHFCPVNSFPVGPNILLSPLFSATLSWCYSLNIRDQVVQPLYTRGKRIVFCMPSLVFLDSRQED